MRGNIRARLERIRERVGPPESPGSGEARGRVLRALETIHGLILEHGDEIDRDCRERVAARPSTVRPQTARLAAMSAPLWSWPAATRSRQSRSISSPCSRMSP